MSLFDNIPEGTDIIEVRKKVNKMLSEARKKAKPPKCILCGKEQSSFCNSHSVPQMCLQIGEKFYMHHWQWDLI